MHPILDATPLPLADHLGRLRVLKALSLDRAAGLLGLTPARLADWEAGRAVPGLLQLDQLSDLYEQTPDALLSGRTVQPWPDPALHVLGFDPPEHRLAARRWTRLLGSLGELDDELRDAGLHPFPDTAAPGRAVWPGTVAAQDWLHPGTVRRVLAEQPHVPLFERLQAHGVFASRRPVSSTVPATAPAALLGLGLTHPRLGLCLCVPTGLGPETEEPLLVLTLQTLLAQHELQPGYRGVCAAQLPGSLTGTGMPPEHHGDALPVPNALFRALGSLVEQDVLSPSALASLLQMNTEALIAALHEETKR